MSGMSIWRVTLLGSACLLWLPAIGSAAPTPAFPGAEGFAALTPGGRGGAVHVVRNLCDYRPFMVIDGATWSASNPPDAFSCSATGTRPDETLRWGIEEIAGPRTIVFAVGGTIYTRDDLVIEDGEGQITIAGQSAPAPGITLAVWYEEAGGLGGSTNTSSSPVQIRGQDVVLRHLRIRPGPGCEAAIALPPLTESVTDAECSACEPDCDPLCGTRAQYGPTDSPYYPECRRSGHDALVIQETARRVMIDHVSMSWGIDENVSAFQGHDGIFSDGTLPQDITIQHSIISQGLTRSVHDKGTSHSMGMLLQGVRRVSLHHNYLAYNMNRSPRILADGEIEFVSNVVYGFGFSAAALIAREDAAPAWSSTSLDFAHNYYNRGSWFTDGEDYGSLVNRSRFSRNYDAVSEPNPGHILAFDFDTPFAALTSATSLFGVFSTGNEFINPFPSVASPRFAGQSDTYVDFPWCEDTAGATRFTTSPPLCDGLATPSSSLAVVAAGASLMGGHPTRVPVTTTAVSGLPAVLQDVGATLPSRDAVDASVVALALDGPGFEDDPTNGGFVDRPPRLFCTGVVDCGGATPDRWWPDMNPGAPAADVDLDGMADVWESANSVSDPNGDPDLDGYTNLEEFLNATLPLSCDFDSDADGVCELADNCPDTPNPLQIDSNADGIGDACGALPVPALQPAIALALVVLLATIAGLRRTEADATPRGRRRV